jgi:hypothetical protein
VTASVARGTARRTVRVAVALVAGQAALCAVIGYLTLGGPSLHHRTAAPESNPLAAGPIEVPPALVLPAPTAGAPTRPHVSATSSRPPSRRGAARTSAPAPRQRAEVEAPPSLVSAPMDPSPEPVPPQVPTATPAPSTGNQLVTPSATPSAVQLNVKVGDPCSPVGAAGQTTDGKAVTCVQGVDGTLRWVLV